MSNNNKNLLIAAAVVAGLVLLMLAWRAGKDENGMMGDNGTGSKSKSTETTAASGTYACADGKSFTLTVMADGTARVTGASSAGVVLHRSQSAHIWISADAKVAVREVANYTTLIENDVTTRDRCHLK